MAVSDALVLAVELVDVVESPEPGEEARVVEHLDAATDRDQSLELVTLVGEDHDQSVGGAKGPALRAEKPRVSAASLGRLGDRCRAVLDEQEAADDVVHGEHGLRPLTGS